MRGRKDEKGSVLMKIYSCHEHIALALDTIVAEQETFPLFNHLTNKQKQSTTCEYCEDNAIYIVTNAHSDTKCG